MKLPKLKVGTAIKVVWLDSHFHEKGWMAEDELDDGYRVEITSICQYMGIDDDYLHTAADRGDFGILRDLKIPLGCIQRIRILK
jgi:hypothetical protein